MKMTAQFDVIIDGIDRSWNIPLQKSPGVSEVSVYPSAQCKTELQREIAKNGKIVMIGRDIGTVVLPHPK